MDKNTGIRNIQQCCLQFFLNMLLLINFWRKRKKNIRPALNSLQQAIKDDKGLLLLYKKKTVTYPQDAAALKTGSYCAL
jgi:hypothetical protein